MPSYFCRNAMGGGRGGETEAGHQQRPSCVCPPCAWTRLWEDENAAYLYQGLEGLAQALREHSIHNRDSNVKEHPGTEVKVHPNDPDTRIRPAKHGGCYAWGVDWRWHHLYSLSPARCRRQWETSQGQDCMGNIQPHGDQWQKGMDMHVYRIEQHVHGQFLKCSARNLWACCSIYCMSGCSDILVAQALQMYYSGY